MQLYWPRPTAPGVPNDCYQCGATIDGDTRTGVWLEREQWQGPNRHELTCLDCCPEESNEAAVGDDAVEEIDQPLYP
ncbi:hypothetical protein QA600_11295 [Natronococcus sp. A-GB1]|uniref:hypothetical protein n=1 Tax=Natronococcus sp. A-GB1 TaxID=3037648 RepID=UPI00241F97EE|nr:hypothetical protein [Natronococcus sp. A-GB1]MDG5759924.1 hypothetical protein [Natronococcus sp. A-GB1]